jgi:hypothetical protein
MKIFKILFSVLVAVIFAMVGGHITSMAVGCSPVIPSLAFFGASFIPTPKGCAALNIFTAPGGVATPFMWQMNYLPEHLSFDNTVPLTSLKVETTEDGVLHDWTAAGLIATGNFMVKGAVPAGTLQFRLSDGELRPKNVTISGVTSAAGAVPFFISSDRIGQLPIKSKNSYVLPNNPTTFEKFTALFIPTMATVTDRVEITYRSGLQQTFAMEDLLNLSANFQNVPGVIINNYTSYISKVIITCAAATPVYVINIVIPGQTV